MNSSWRTRTHTKNGKLRNKRTHAKVELFCFFFNFTPYEPPSLCISLFPLKITSLFSTKASNFQYALLLHSNNIKLCFFLQIVPQHSRRLHKEPMWTLPTTPPSSRLFEAGITRRSPPYSPRAARMWTSAAGMVSPLSSSLCNNGITGQRCCYATLPGWTSTCWTATINRRSRGQCRFAGMTYSSNSWGMEPLATKILFYKTHCSRSTGKLRCFWSGKDWMSTQVKPTWTRPLCWPCVTSGVMLWRRWSRGVQVSTSWSVVGEPTDSYAPCATTGI